MHWRSYYIEKLGLYHLYCKIGMEVEHGVFDMLGAIKTVDRNAEGMLQAWPVSVVSIIDSANNRTEVAVDGDCFMVKAPYSECKRVLLGTIVRHDRTAPLHYIYKDKHKGEHSRMIFVVDHEKYTKADVMNIFREASRG